MNTQQIINEILSLKARVATLEHLAELFRREPWCAGIPATILPPVNAD